MIEILRDPLWQSIGVVLAAIAIVISIFVYSRQQRWKRLSYHIIANIPVLTMHERFRGQLKVLYEDVPVKNVQLVLLRLINTGNVPIATADFERPLTITFGADAHILSSEIVASSPADLSPSISATAQGITLSPLLLNANDHVTIKAIVSDHEGGIAVAARIIGVESVLQLKESPMKRFVPLIVGIASGVLTAQVNNILTGSIVYLVGISGVVFLIGWLMNRKRHETKGA